MPASSRRSILALFLGATLLSGCAVGPLKETSSAAPKSEKSSASKASSAKNAKSTSRKTTPAKNAKAAESLAPSAAEQTPAKPASIPVFLPSIDEAPKLSLDQQIVIRFSQTAAEHGAPKSVPPLRATVLTAPGSVQAVFSALGMTVWRITWDGNTITEARSPRLDAHVEAQRLLRDLAFTLWPAGSVRKAVPEGYVFSCRLRGTTEIRELSLDGATLLSAHITQMGGRSIITIENAAEGYSLQIESLL